VLSNKTRPDGTKKRVSEMTKENLGILLAIRDNNPLIKSFSDMEAYIEDFFKSDYISKDTIVLCTAHKAKGLQAKNVYIYHPDKLPYSHPKQQPWQFEQELNLQYVAYTRAMENLLFIEGKAESSNLLDLENAMEEGDL
jgi:superfamily I DNA/RNA helicase